MSPPVKSQKTGSCFYLAAPHAWFAETRSTTTHGRDNYVVSRRSITCLTAWQLLCASSKSAAALLVLFVERSCTAHVLPMKSEQASVRPLTTADLDSVVRLHRFSSSQQGTVFGSSDLTEVLSAAAQRQSGAFGYVACVTDPDEPEEEEVVGALTAQCSANISSSADTPSSEKAEMTELVLLTLVVRADARRKGVGAQLMAMLLQSAQQLQQQQGVTRVVADVALANDQAWGFFRKAGFTQGQACDGTAEAVLLLAKQQQQSAGSDGAGKGGTTAAAAVKGRLQHVHLATTISLACARHGQFCSNTRSQQQWGRQWLPGWQLHSSQQALVGYKPRCRSIATRVSLSHVSYTAKMLRAMLA